ncbi:type VII secretion protein EssC [Radiobacillus kanasensis]|uniref:type VII secretion protein EssC n=1 Tax=Radiobacillus kanasensis TaxID=2844358 RepID=UPI001E582971|nr:type VII secretion protein EssC [Radiobacillus kanasensis]UFT99208.1 type VII secretion protein EssC [Radiobacillus kanasensis]
MLLTLFDRGKAFHLVLPERITGRYTLQTMDGDTQQDMMAVEAENGTWFLKSNKYAYLKEDANQKLYKMAIEPYMTYSIFRDGESTALLYVEPTPSRDKSEYTKHRVHSSSVHIGRSKDAHICYANKLVSSMHCTIMYDSQGTATIMDNNSANGTYVNGEMVKEKKLEIGDVIYIMGLKIIFNGNLLALNNPNQSVLLDKEAFQPFVPEEPIVVDEEELDDFLVKEDQQDLFYRSPRFKRDIEERTIKIDPPPQQPNLEETPLMLMLGPSITMGMASLFMGIFAVQNVMRTNGDIMYALPTLMMSLSMLTGTVLWPILTKKHEKKKRDEHESKRQEKYKQYIEEMGQVIEEECRHQSEILHENHQPLNHYLNRIRSKERSLWERTIGQNDFLKVRLGLGDVPLQAEIKYPEKKFTLEDDNLQDELYKLAEQPKVLKDVPVTLSLIEEPITGVIGKRELVQDFVKGLVFQLSALHSYDELKFVFLYDKKEQETWNFLKWLPHAWNDEKTIRFIATDANEIKELSAYFEKVIASRVEIASDSREQLTDHYVVFSMSRKLASKAEMINLLLKEKLDIGVSLITLYDELKNLPKETTMVVELDQGVSKLYDKDDITGRYVGFETDIYMPEEAEELAIQLANIQLATSMEAFALPEMLTFLEMFGVGKIEHLNALTRWKENNPTLTIETPIGVSTTGDLFNIDLHEKYHGPHGLIAGMTGSGKSEFIMTFILSLAVNYHPDEVAFILIDYKGGGMANSFSELPHLAGTITNLDGAAVNRSLISIQSELKRRQAIFGEASRKMNESNIDIYKYQKLYREGLVSEPLQHLFMISDEFAELKTQQPEFMDQLVSAARIGRSLGVHLILATQKPSGVVDDQIWSNSKFRISLKVQEKADSMEVIKRPDAAELTTTGRFYLQVGYNEIFELGQSAWGGAPYIPTDKVEKSKDDSVVVIDNLGRIVKSAKVDKNQGQVKNPPKQIDEVTKYLAHLAKQENIKVKQLWLEPIPALIYIDKLREKYPLKTTNRFELNPIIGEYDDPANQSQELLSFPITQEGNALIYGVSGSGKTTWISSLLYSLMEEHTPEEVNLYVLDFGTETLTWFQQSPHVGDVMLSSDTEKINNLFQYLNREVDTRKKQLSNYGGDFTSYNSVSEQGLPSIVVIIHNYSAFSEMYEDQEETLSFLTREGTKYGIYFIVTATNTGAIRYRLLQNFKQTYVLQLNDQSDYSGILGNVDGVYPAKHKGRGIFKSGSTYEFQIAHISKQATNLYSFITEYCKQKRDNWSKQSAPRIPILPDAVDMEYVKEVLNDKRITQMPVGVEKETLEVSYYDFQKSYINLVLASYNSNFTGFIQGISEVHSAYGDGEVILFDPNGHAFDEPPILDYVADTSELEAKVVDLFNTLVHRNNTKKDAIENGEPEPQFPRITCVIDSFSDLLAQLSDDGQDKLKVFLQKGDSLNVSIILSDTPDRLNTMSFEPWFKEHVSLSDLIWIGNGISDQFMLKLKLPPSMYKEIPEDFGYVVKKGSPVLTKMLTKSSKKEAVYHG